MSNTLRRLTLCVGFLVMCAPSARAQGVSGASAVPPTTGYALVRGNRIDVLFPRVPLESLECRRPRIGAMQPRFYGNIRLYAWKVGWNRVDTARAREHEAYLDIRAVFPNAAKPGVASIDSALAERTLWVMQTDDAWPSTRVFGEVGPAPPTTIFDPERRAMYLDQGRLHVAMQGSEALHALLDGSGDTLTISMCRLSPLEPLMKIPVIRR
ncbi:MAG TPA: hypothetical protein VGM50_06625 [Gemmatimonadaceae bacterium]